MKRATVKVLSGVTIAVVVSLWAVSLRGAAHLPLTAALPQVSTQKSNRLPAPVRFHNERDRGLVTDAWINGQGPFRFVIDTGAEITVVTQGLASRIGLRTMKGQPSVVAGLSGRQIAAGETIIDRLALDYAGNVMPGSVRTIVVPTLPQGIDGLIDPGSVYSPFGYTIDLPRQEMRAFDPRVNGLSLQRQPAEGAVVPWVRGRGDRPFVRLSDGRLALIDTGSGLGFAIMTASPVLREHTKASRDIGGGVVRSTRVSPTTVSIGALVLRGVPTDVISGMDKGAPTILGRDALYPFRISFDPVRRLIEIAPSLHDGD